MKKRALGITLGFLAGFLISMVIFKSGMSYEARIDSTWEIKIPLERKLMFKTISLKDEEMKDGYYPEYRVYESEKGQKKEELRQILVTKQRYNEEKNPEMEKEFNKLLDEDRIQEDMRPDFSEDYIWFKADPSLKSHLTAYAVYQEDSDRFYIIETRKLK